jgi:CheY-like chemotaxis protein
MLLADDSITIQKVIDLTFADEGMQVTTVSNGEQALEKLEEVAPDIVLADVFMPGLNGYEVCEHIKRNERFRHIPVMLLVGSFEPFDEAEARRVGADDFLTKPFQSIRQLVNKVGALLSGAAEDEATTKDLKLPDAVARAERERGSAGPSELSMADTAPLPQLKDEAASAAAAGHESFDDGMIESAPASSFSSAAGDGVDRHLQPTASLADEEFDEVRINPSAEISSRRAADDTDSSQMQETRQSFSFNESGAAEAVGQSATAAPYMAQAVEADEALLDLGDIEPPAATVEADDFILDLQYEARQPPAPPISDAPAPPADELLSEETLIDFQGETGASAPQVEEFAEAAAAMEEEPGELTATEELTPAEMIGEVAPVEEEPQVADADMVFQDTLEPPAAALTETQPVAGASLTETMASPVDSEAPSAVTGSAPAPSAASQITLEQLSPEVIDAISRRVVEQLSEKVVQEIAWEVVPQLAELLIKRKLEEEKQ